MSMQKVTLEEVTDSSSEDDTTIHSRRNLDSADAVPEYSANINQPRDTVDDKSMDDEALFDQPEGPPLEKPLLAAAQKALEQRKAKEATEEEPSNEGTTNGLSNIVENLNQPREEHESDADDSLGDDMLLIFDPPKPPPQAKPLLAEAQKAKEEVIQTSTIIEEEEEESSVEEKRPVTTPPVPPPPIIEEATPRLSNTWKETVTLKRVEPRSSFESTDGGKKDSLKPSPRRSVSEDEGGDSMKPSTGRSDADDGGHVSLKPENIIAFKEMQGLGKSEFIGNCATNIQDRKNYYGGWCQFVKAAKSMDATVTALDVGVPVDFYLYENGTTTKADGSFETEFVDAVACAPRNSEFDMTLKGKKWPKAAKKI